MGKNMQQPHKYHSFAYICEKYEHMYAKKIQNMQASFLYADLQNMQKYEVPTLLVMSH